MLIVFYFDISINMSIYLYSSKGRRFFYLNQAIKQIILLVLEYNLKSDKVLKKVIILLIKTYRNWKVNFSRSNSNTHQVRKCLSDVNYLCDFESLNKYIVYFLLKMQSEQKKQE